MQLSAAQADRAAGVLLGQAVGDALGVPYEFGSRPFDPAVDPQMLGGGLGPYAPGEWSDDTQMALAIARVAVTGAADLSRPDGLDEVAASFLGWFDDGPADIGNQTAGVLADATRRRGREPGTQVAEHMRHAAQAHHERTGRSAGNGALMRTSILGLVALDDRDGTAGIARSVAELTHWDPLAGDSCVLWCEAVRRAVMEGHLDLRGGLDLIPPDRRNFWEQAIDTAEGGEPQSFTPNGFTVTALQAAWSSIVHTTPEQPGPAHVPAALHTAISVGDDTDTVAAIAGGLLGARYGASGLPSRWTRDLHGWPGRTADELPRLALRIASRDPANGRPRQGGATSTPPPV